MIWPNDLVVPLPAVSGLERAPIDDPEPPARPPVDEPGRELPAVDPRRPEAPEPVREPRRNPAAEPRPH